MNIDFSNLDETLFKFSLAFVPAAFGIICHEVAHGWVAYKQGDPTAKMLGRLTLNPIKHVDPMGALVFVLTALTSPFVIGWAKPVPVNPRYFRHPREGMVFVSVAGPVANLLVALFCAFLYRFTDQPDGAIMQFIHLASSYGVVMNCWLAWFNLMPVPPLDGSHIVANLLPRQMADAYASIGRYGMLIVIGLVMTGLLNRIIVPLVRDTVSVISMLAGANIGF